MHKFILYILLFGVVSVEAQNEVHIDSVLNIYERRYRVELNDSDFEVIEAIVAKVEDSECTVLLDTLRAGNLSNPIIEELVRRSIDKELCLREIIDNLDFRKLGYLDDDFEQDYPIFTAIRKKPASLRLLYDYLEESDYLSDCDLIYKAGRRQIRFLKHFLASKEVGESKNDCARANVTLISKMKI